MHRKDEDRPISSCVDSLGTCSPHLPRADHPHTHSLSLAAEHRCRMFTLLSDIYANYSRREEYSILILGLDDAGKSTLLESLKQTTSKDPSTSSHKPSRTTPTIGQNIAKLLWRGTRFQIWDLGGQQGLRELWTRYYDVSHIVVFVIDSSSRVRLDESVLTLRQVSTSLEPLNVPILVVANKQDLAETIEVAEIKERVNAIIEGMEAKEGGVLGCSAITGQGVDQVMEWIYSRTDRNKRSRPPILR